MNLTDLFEEAKTGKVQYQSKYDNLFHLTDSRGFSLVVDQNRLSALRENYISTTYKMHTTSILGRQNYHFKLILDGPALAKEYGIFPVDFYAQEVGGGKRKKVQIEEYEYGVNTKTIEDVAKYVKGLILNVSFDSESIVRSMAKDNAPRRAGFMQPHEMAGSPASIAALYKFVFAWKKPVYVIDNKKLRGLTQLERTMLKDMYRMYRKGYSYRDILGTMGDKYDIKDIFGNVQRSYILANRSKLFKMFDELNEYLTEIPIMQLEDRQIKAIVVKIVNSLNFDNKQYWLDRFDRAGIYRKDISPVQWGTLLKYVAQNDFDGLDHAVTNVENSHMPELDGNSKSKHVRTEISESQRLDELVGVKKYTNQNSDLALLRDALKKQGHTILGAGSFGLTVEHANGYVVKFYTNDDVCYDAFVDYCRQHSDNPHLPRFKTKNIKFADKYFTMIRLEMLNNIKFKNPDIWNLNSIIRELDFESGKYTRPAKHSFDVDLHAVIENLKDEENVDVSDIINQHEEFLQTWYDLKACFPEGKCMFDVRDLTSNVMCRSDGTLVIIDPWAPQSSL